MGIAILQATASAVLFAIALPNEVFPYGVPWLSLLALAPFFVALVRTERLRDAALLGAVFGALSTVLSNYWLANFGEFAVWTIGGPTVGYIVYNSILAPVLRRLADFPTHLRPFVLAAAWTAYEYLKSIGFLGYPWGLAGYPLSDYPALIQHVEITGAWALSFVAVAANTILAELILSADTNLRLPATGREVRAATSAFTHGIASRNLDTLSPAPRIHLPTAAAARFHAPAAVGFLALLFALMAGFGFTRLETSFPKIAELETVLVQQDTDSWAVGAEERGLQRAQELTRAALEAEPTAPELIVWSETTLRRSLREHRDYFLTRPSGDPFIPFLGELGVPLLTGAPYVEHDEDSGERRSYNAAVLLDERAEIRQVYGKRHLVPFTEAIPLWEYAPVRWFFQEMVGIHGAWTPGPRYTLFELPLERQGNSGERLRFGTPICFEDAFAYINREFTLAGADLLINLTNNSWSATDSAQTQHFVAARFRAVENRRTLVRSTNSGLTSVLDAHGRVIADIPMFTESYLRTEVPVYRPEEFTIYTRFGDYLPQAFLALVVVGITLPLHSERRASGLGGRPGGRRNRPR